MSNKELLKDGVGRRQPYIGPADAPPEVTAKIVDVTVDKMTVEEESGSRRVAAANVKVEFSDREAKWVQVFQFPILGIIEWDTFLSKIQDKVISDYQVDRGLSEIMRRKGKSFKVFPKT